MPSTLLVIIRAGKIPNAAHENDAEYFNLQVI